MAKGTVKWFDPKKGSGSSSMKRAKTFSCIIQALTARAFGACGTARSWYEQLRRQGLQGRSVQIIEVKAMSPPRRRPNPAGSGTIHARARFLPAMSAWGL